MPLWDLVITDSIDIKRVVSISSVFVLFFFGKSRWIGVKNFVFQVAVRLKPFVSLLLKQIVRILIILQKERLFLIEHNRFWNVRMIGLALSSMIGVCGYIVLIKEVVVGFVERYWQIGRAERVVLFCVMLLFGISDYGVFVNFLL